MLCARPSSTPIESDLPDMGNPLTDRIRRIIAETPRRTVDDPSLTPAGVMVLIYPNNGEHCVLLQKRSNRVDSHKGEISFPGGKRDPEDTTILDTALRETHEEMGIDPLDVEVLGALDETATTSGFCTSPFAGTIPYPYDFSPCEDEVAEVLEVPVSSLMDISNRRDEIHVAGGDLQYAPVFAYDGHIIFGATARILNRFMEMLETPAREELP